MDQHTKENWEKIKKHFEEIKQTSSPFYKRACLICAGKPDPFDAKEYGIDLDVQKE